MKIINRNKSEKTEMTGIIRHPTSTITIQRKEVRKNKVKNHRPTKQTKKIKKITERKHNNNNNNNST